MGLFFFEFIICEPSPISFLVNIILVVVIGSDNLISRLIVKDGLFV